MTANHLGYFEFRICNTDNLQGQDATQSCLDRTVLSDKLGRKQFYIGISVLRLYFWRIRLIEMFVYNKDLVLEESTYSWFYLED